MNPNKPKNRLAGKTLDKDKKGKHRLQLKGRIFMQNVTDVLTFAKNGKSDQSSADVVRILKTNSGSYLLQIFWKGDPGIENFVIRFLSIEIRDKWHRLVEEQILHLPKSSRDPAASNTSQTQFISLAGSQPENPFLTHEEEDEDDSDMAVRISNATTLVNSQADFMSSRNASTTSLRSRSTTGGSGPPAGPPASLFGAGAPARVPPPRFPVPEPGGPTPPPLKVSTSFGTPDERIGNSYFSPTADSPSSLRSASQASMYPFPRQPNTHVSNWPADGNKHNTAPPMGRAPLREDDSANGYSINSRSVQRPSLPVLADSQSAQQHAFAQNRSRSMSTPDVHNQHSPGKRQHGADRMDEIPVPPIPPHMASMRAPINRSQNSSPTEMIRRNGAQSPHLTRTHTSNSIYSNHERTDPRVMQYHGPGPTPSGMNQRIISPASQQGDTPFVSQLKVKIHFEPMPSHMTIVVPCIIKHRSLIDRIDSKMEKISSCSIAKSTAKLRYKDMDDEFITIANDEDIVLAVDEWTQANLATLKEGMIPDFEVYFCEQPS